MIADDFRQHPRSLQRVTASAAARHVAISMSLRDTPSHGVEAVDSAELGETTMTDRHWIIDTGSTNGLWIDGARTAASRLDRRCRIDMGDVHMRWVPLG